MLAEGSESPNAPTTGAVFAGHTARAALPVLAAAAEIAGNGLRLAVSGRGTLLAIAPDGSLYGWEEPDFHLLGEEQSAISFEKYRRRRDQYIYRSGAGHQLGDERGLVPGAPVHPKRRNPGVK